MPTVRVRLRTRLRSSRLLWVAWANVLARAFAQLAPSFLLAELDGIIKLFASCPAEGTLGFRLTRER
jgi:hypothetical protein